jgi:hypothetical protein
MKPLKEGTIALLTHMADASGQVARHASRIATDTALSPRRATRARTDEGPPGVFTVVYGY